MNVFKLTFWSYECLQVNVFKSNEHGEHSEYSYIGLCDFSCFFFQEKVLKFVHLFTLNFDFSRFDF